MARRRRSLLGSTGPSLPPLPPSPDADAGASAAPADPEAEASPAPEGSAPEADPTPDEAAEPVEPDASATEAVEVGATEPITDALAPRSAPSAAPSEGELDELYREDFGDFSEAPPTEEVPGGVYHDVSAPYSAPMNVPEPPPIPGIADRFTPPPVQRTQIGAKQVADRPSYLAEPTPDPAPFREEKDIQGFKSYEQQLAEERAAFEEPAERGVPLGWLLGGGAVAGILALVLGIGAAAFVLGGGQAGPVDDGRLQKEVQVRTDMRAERRLFGVPDEALEEAAEEELEGEEEEPADAAPEAPEPAPVAAPEPVAAPAPPPRPRQRAAPRPQPAPAPAAAPAPVAADLGTLKIRSTRRVLVYVNGQAIGFTPYEYKAPPGTYSLSASLAGQPDTEQVIRVELPSAGVVPVDFQF